MRRHVDACPLGHFDSRLDFGEAHLLVRHRFGGVRIASASIHGDFDQVRAHLDLIARRLTDTFRRIADAGAPCHVHAGDAHDAVKMAASAGQRHTADKEPRPRKETGIDGIAHGHVDVIATAQITKGGDPHAQGRLRPMQRFERSFADQLFVVDGAPRRPPRITRSHDVCMRIDQARDHGVGP